MTARIKHVSLVLLIQSSCLGVGLWMQHRYTVASVTGAADEQLWSDIEVIAREAFSALAGGPPGAGLADDDGRDLAARLTAFQKLGLADVTVVDPQWRVIFPPGDARSRLQPEGMSQSSVMWTPLARGAEDSGPYGRGQALFPDGPHVAVARALDGGAGYLLVHLPAGFAQERVSALTQSMPTLSVMTFAWICALLNFAAYLVLARLHDQMEVERSRSASDAVRKTQNLLRMRDAVIFGLAKLAESRDPETGDHLERISVYSTYLASEMRRHAKFREQVTPAFMRLIGISSALHDIGKVGVEDRILRKRGPLTREERTAMQAHSVIGGRCLQEIERRLGGSNFLQMAREIAFSHHENWDGSGYPNGLAGAAIPLSARIVAIADVYDALSCRRVYKEAYAHERCVAMMRNESGRKFDPDILALWVTIEPKFRSVAVQYSGDATGTLNGAPAGPTSPTNPNADKEEMCPASSGTEL